MEKKPVWSILTAILFILAVSIIGYISFGIVPASLFFSGYVFGFILWLTVPTKASFQSIKWLYIATFLLFMLHRVEEKISGFFAVLAEMTGVPTPEIVSVQIMLLLMVSIGAWVAAPFLYKSKSEIGYYLVWSFFASMGVTELAHFVFPFFRPESYGYFPGMASVVILAPVAWYSMYKLAKNVDGQ